MHSETEFLRWPDSLWHHTQFEKHFITSQFTEKSEQCIDSPIRTKLTWFENREIRIIRLSKTLPKWLTNRFRLESNKCSQIDQFRYLKIRPKTIDLSTRLWGKLHSLWILFPKPRAEVYCVRLNYICIGNRTTFSYNSWLIGTSDFSWKFSKLHEPLGEWNLRIFKITSTY